MPSMSRDEVLEIIEKAAWEGATALDFSGNQMASLPAEIGQLKALQTLDLGGNNLTALPPDIGKLEALQTLTLSGNPLPIPTEILKITNAPKIVIDYYFREHPPEENKRLCFVIIPFSTTASTTEEEWTDIFENVFRPAIEGAGLNYECRRSEATRGNLIAAIIRDLNDAFVVVADLTDRNPNVFYELGVRHSLKNRTIILAQKRDDIPSDLQGYASHVYSWKTQRSKDELERKLRELLEDIDKNPQRPDSPVSDFLLEPQDVDSISS